MDQLRPGAVFAGRYEVVRVLSTGGMGIVYEVLHTETQRKRALKVMLPSLLVDEDMRSRFRREAVVTAGIESEHLVEIFDAGIEESTRAPFLVMELLRGEDLGARLEREGRLAKKDVLTLTRQVALALDKTHAAGVVHRDLKPENVFVTRRDDGTPRVKVLDFGIAKLVSRNRQAAGKTRAVGTPLYMAPEQMVGDSAKIGPSADLYALGHIVFTLLAGQPYFAPEADESDNVLGLLMKISRGAPEPAGVRARAAGVSLPATFDVWFARATALDPSHRFTSAYELARSLDEAFEGVEPAVLSSKRRLLATLPTVDAGDSGPIGSGPIGSGPAMAEGLPPKRPSAMAETRDAPYASVEKGASASARTGTRDSAPDERLGLGGGSDAGTPSSRTLALDDAPRTRRLRWVGLGGAAALAVVAVYLTVGPGAPEPKAPSAATNESAGRPLASAAPATAEPAASITIRPVPSASAASAVSATAPSAMVAASALSARSPAGSSARPKPLPTATAAAPTSPTAIPTTWGGPRR
jgi:serine/threonine-protein kinase